MLSITVKSDGLIVLVDSHGKEIELGYPAAPRWIPVTERLPEVGALVLACDKGGDIQIASMAFESRRYPDMPRWTCDTSGVDGYDYGPEHPDVTHWMPLPKTPYV